MTDNKQRVAENAEVKLPALVNQFSNNKQQSIDPSPIGQ